MANIVKGTFNVNNDDDKASEIDKFVKWYWSWTVSLFGDAIKKKINLPRQIKIEPLVDLIQENLRSEIVNVINFKRVTKQYCC